MNGEGGGAGAKFRGELERDLVIENASDFSAIRNAFDGDAVQNACTTIRMVSIKKKDALQHPPPPAESGRGRWRIRIPWARVQSAPPRERDPRRYL